jgi:anti-sigma factor (TIGR02949 family)
MSEPIDCREAEARLYDYLKQELTPELAAEVKDHLVRCRGCFGHARFEERLLILIEVRARRETCPGALRDRIRALLRAEAERS